MVEPNVPTASLAQVQEAVQSQYPQLEEAAKQRLAQEAEELAVGTVKNGRADFNHISTIQLIALGALALHLYSFVMF